MRTAQIDIYKFKELSRKIRTEKCRERQRIVLSNFDIRYVRRDTWSDVVKKTKYIERTPYDNEPIVHFSSALNIYLSHISLTFDAHRAFRQKDLPIKDGLVYVSLHYSSRSDKIKFDRWHINVHDCQNNTFDREKFWEIAKVAIEKRVRPMLQEMCKRLYDTVAHLSLPSIAKMIEVEDQEYFENGNPYIWHDCEKSLISAPSGSKIAK